MGRDLRVKRIAHDDDRECKYDWFLAYGDVHEEYCGSSMPIDFGRHNSYIPSGRFTRQQLISEMQRLMWRTIESDEGANDAGSDTGDVESDNDYEDEVLDAIAVLAQLIQYVPRGGWLIIDYS